jgi:hypothetical protein
MMHTGCLETTRGTPSRREDPHAHEPFPLVRRRAVPAAVAAPTYEEVARDLDAIDELTRERTQALGTLVRLALLTAVLATLVWSVGPALP